METRTGIFAEALAAALSLPGEEEAFFEALHKQAVSGKVVIAKMLANTLNENPQQGLRSRLVAFLKEKARVARLVFAVLMHIGKGNSSYARLAIKQFPSSSAAKGKPTISSEILIATHARLEHSLVPPHKPRKTGGKSG